MRDARDHVFCADVHCDEAERPRDAIGKDDAHRDLSGSKTEHDGVWRDATEKLASYYPRWMLGQLFIRMRGETRSCE